MTSLREQFAAVLASAPLVRCDAMLVCAGEDAEPRLRMACALMAQGGAPQMVLSGGIHDPPHKLGARALGPKAIGFGVAFDRLVIDEASKHTRDQAVYITQLAKAQQWTRVLLVASPYHMPRVFLSCVQALREIEATEIVRLCPAPGQFGMAPELLTPWWGAPDGMEATRLDLLTEEYLKIEAYQARGHCATYEDGLAYLKYWESAK